MSDVIAIDVDLRRIHAWSRDHGQVCYKAPDTGQLCLFFAMHPEWNKSSLTILLEVASAQSYQDGDARKLYQKRRWMIYNMAIAGQLWVNITGMANFLVAPSSAWTMGYEEKARHALAKADAKNHDLKECQAMLAFYKMKPDKWVPYRQYLDEIL